MAWHIYLYSMSGDLIRLCMVCYIHVHSMSFCIWRIIIFTRTQCLCVSVGLLSQSIIFTCTQYLCVSGNLLQQLIMLTFTQCLRVFGNFFGSLYLHALNVYVISWLIIFTCICCLENVTVQPERRFRKQKAIHFGAYLSLLFFSFFRHYALLILKYFCNSKLSMRQLVYILVMQLAQLTNPNSHPQS